jgi:hypothetical protein
MKTRVCPKIQTCPRCGQMRVHHPNGYYECPVPREVTEALRQFRDDNGRRWKSKLRELWMQGADADDFLLRQARNMIGPTRLDKIEL